MGVPDMPESDSTRVKQRKVVVFGAGSVGRGFIGELFCAAGWQVTFVDAAAEIVDALAAEGSYPHVTVSGDRTQRAVVGPVAALNARNLGQVLTVVVGADLVVTCVGSRALPKVMDTVALAVAQRVEHGMAPLDILLAENLHDGSTIVREMLASRLPGVAQSTLDAQVGVMESSIGRMIPVPDPIHSVAPTAIWVEPYRLLPYDAAAGRGEPLNVPGLIADPTVPFAFYADRKLYVHNMGHFLCGLLARTAGHRLLWEGVDDPQIRYITRAAMIESCTGLAARYNRPLAPLVDHVDDLLHRFGNRALGDPVERVIRDPGRKMASDDRVMGAFSLAVESGTPSRHLSLVVAVGAAHLEATEGWTAADTSRYLQDAALHTKVPWTEVRRGLLDAQLTALRDHGFEFAEQISIIGDQFNPPTIP